MDRSFADSLYRGYAEWRVGHFLSRRFSPEDFEKNIKDFCPAKAEIAEIGTSFEGRRIRLISVGGGKTAVLLWSQMHGDESTATMAIADILNYLRRHPDDKPTAEILSSLRLYFLPILNPDGAARFQRRTAQGIDMNRDAVALQTPEARLLKHVQQQYSPAFGFNLHDQELSTVGTSRELTAIAVLAPSFDERHSDNETRIRAKHLAASFVEIMNVFIPGKIARYEDIFDPRAFGDTMQRSGTSTILVESGHMPNDPEKNTIRQLNAVGILAVLHAIAAGEYVHSDLTVCESLPLNGKRAYDLIIRNIRLEHTNGITTEADLAISYQVDTHMESAPMLVDLGDLHSYTALREIDGKQKIIPFELLVMNKPFAWEQYFAA